jgi:hypothetical protein
LERFVRKMEAQQVEAIDAALDVTDTSDKGHDPDRHHDTMVEPAH